MGNEGVTSSAELTVDDMNEKRKTEGISFIINFIYVSNKSLPLNFKE
jgi:hypothetical protein